MKDDRHITRDYDKGIETETREMLIDPVEGSIEINGVKYPAKVMSVQVGASKVPGGGNLEGAKLTRDANGIIATEWSIS